MMHINTTQRNDRWKLACFKRFFIFPFFLLSVFFTVSVTSEVPAPWPQFENVVYTNSGVSTQVGRVPFTECRVSDPSGTRHRNLECGWFEVPEDYSDPEGKKITLFIGRLKAAGNKAEEDPLILIEGGPGGAPSESFIFPGRGFDKIQQQRDIYLIDQRGTGKSNPLRCPTLTEFAFDFSVEKIRELAQECLAQLPGDPQFYTTSVAVRDLDRIREALGYDQWNIYGVSYGSRVAQHYLRRFPEATRAVILDGVVYPSLNLGPDIALQSQRALRQLIERCAGSDECRQQYPDLEEGIKRLFTQLKNNPLTVEVNNFSTGRKETIEFTELHLVAVVRFALYSPASAAILPVMLHEAYANNNFEPLARNALEYSAALETAISIGMHNSVVCTEDIPFIDESALNKAALENTYMGTEAIDSMLAMCEVWPRGVLDEDFKLPVVSDKPVLLLSGGADPITPPEYAEKAAEQLSNSKHIVVPGHGHGISYLGCVPILMAKFIENASLDNLRTDCLEKQEPNPFFIDFNGPAP